MCLAVTYHRQYCCFYNCISVSSLNLLQRHAHAGSADLIKDPPCHALLGTLLSRHITRSWTCVGLAAHGSVKSHAFSRTPLSEATLRSSGFYAFTPWQDMALQASLSRRCQALPRPAWQFLVREMPRARQRGMTRSLACSSGPRLACSLACSSGPRLVPRSQAFRYGTCRQACSLACSEG